MDYGRNVGANHPFGHSKWSGLKWTMVEMSVNIALNTLVKAFWSLKWTMVEMSVPQDETKDSSSATV